MLASFAGQKLFMKFQLSVDGLNSLENGVLFRKRLPAPTIESNHACEKGPQLYVGAWEGIAGYW